MEGENLQPPPYLFLLTSKTSIMENEVDGFLDLMPDINLTDEHVVLLGSVQASKDEEPNQQEVITVTEGQEEAPPEEMPESTVEERIESFYQYNKKTLSEQEYTSKAMSAEAFVSVSVQVMKFITEMKEMKEGMEGKEIQAREVMHATASHGEYHKYTAENVSKILLSKPTFGAVVNELNLQCATVGDLYYILQHDGKKGVEGKPHLRLFGGELETFVDENLSKIMQLCIGKYRVRGKRDTESLLACLGTVLLTTSCSPPKIYRKLHGRER